MTGVQVVRFMVTILMFVCGWDPSIAITWYRNVTVVLYGSEVVSSGYTTQRLTLTQKTHKLWVLVECLDFWEASSSIIRTDNRWGENKAILVTYMCMFCVWPFCDTQWVQMIVMVCVCGLKWCCIILYQPVELHAQATRYFARAWDRLRLRLQWQPINERIGSRSQLIT